MYTIILKNYYNHERSKNIDIIGWLEYNNKLQI